jgi:hypothetical protein
VLERVLGKAGTHSKLEHEGNVTFEVHPLLQRRQADVEGEATEVPELPPAA